MSSKWHLKFFILLWNGSNYHCHPQVYWKYSNVAWFFLIKDAITLHYFLCECICLIFSFRYVIFRPLELFELPDLFESRSNFLSFLWSVVESCDARPKMKSRTHLIWRLKESPIKQLMHVYCIYAWTQYSFYHVHPYRRQLKRNSKPGPVDYTFSVHVLETIHCFFF